MKIKASPELTSIDEWSNRQYIAAIGSIVPFFSSIGVTRLEIEWAQPCSSRLAGRD